MRKMVQNDEDFPFSHLKIEKEKQKTSRAHSSRLILSNECKLNFIFFNQSHTLSILIDILN